MEVYFGFCKKCRVVLASKREIFTCPFCKGKLWIDMGVKEEEPWEEGECYRCGTRGSMIEVRVAKLIIYPRKKEVQVGVSAIGAYCKFCTKYYDFFSDTDIVLYPAKLVDMTWSEFLQRLLGFPKLAAQSDANTFIYFKNKLYNLNHAEKIVSLGNWGVELGGFESFRVYFNQSDNKFLKITLYKDDSKEWAVIVNMRGEVLYTGKKVPSPVEVLFM